MKNIFRTSPGKIIVLTLHRDNDGGSEAQAELFIAPRGEEDADAVSNTSFMLTISPPPLSSSIRSSRVIGLLQRFLGPVKKICIKLSVY